jgi:hypothetical protein
MRFLIKANYLSPSHCYESPIQILQEDNRRWRRAILIKTERAFFGSLLSSHASYLFPILLLRFLSNGCVM